MIAGGDPPRPLPATHDPHPPQHHNPRTPAGGECRRRCAVKSAFRRSNTTGVATAAPAAAPAPAAPRPSCPALDAVAAEIDALVERACTTAGPWIELWPRVEGLPPADETALGRESAALRERARAEAAAALKINNLGVSLAASRTLIAATVAVFTGQPNATAWPSRVGRTVSADVIAGDYETFMQSMREYGTKAAALDEAIKAARDSDVLWLLPEGSLRCPLGAAEVLRSLACAANLIASPDDIAGMNRLLGSLAMFSSPGRTQQTLAAIAAPFRQEMIEYTREAQRQLKILQDAGPVSSAEESLAARPFRFRGVDFSSSASSAYVLMVAFWIASGAIVAVLSHNLPPIATGLAGIALFGISTICAMLPARHERRDRWDEAVAAAARAVSVLREALDVKKKPPRANKTPDGAGGAPAQPRAP